MSCPSVFLALENCIYYIVPHFDHSSVANLREAVLIEKDTMLLVYMVREMDTIFGMHFKVNL